MNEAALFRILTWLSPSYPVGAFAYSHGIEWAVEAGWVSDEVTLQGWIDDLVHYGGAWSDCVLFGQAYNHAGDRQALVDLNEMAIALAPTQERHLETTAQGSAFCRITLDAWPWPGCETQVRALGPEVAYPVAVAMAAAGHEIPKDAALQSFLHGCVNNLISAGVRLIPLGQTAGQRILAGLEAPLAAVANEALVAGLDDLGGIAMRSDIAAMRHETQYTRLFRS